MPCEEGKLDSIDELRINVEDLTISGRINSPQLGEPFTITFPIKLFKAEDEDEPLFDAQEVQKRLFNKISELIIDAFKEFN